MAWTYTFRTKIFSVTNPGLDADPEPDLIESPMRIEAWSPELCLSRLLAAKL